MTAQGAIEAWLWDDEHSNTRLSECRSDIGAGVSMSKDEWGQGQINVVIETALQTRSGQLQTWNNLGADTMLYEKQLLLVQKGATQPVVIPTQTATVVFAAFSYPTPSPTSTPAVIPTGTVAPAAGRSGSFVVILIVSVSLLIASASVNLRVKKSHKGRPDFEAMEFDIKQRAPPALCYNHDLSYARSGKPKGPSNLTVKRLSATSVHKLPKTVSSIHTDFTILGIAAYFYRT